MLNAKPNRNGDTPETFKRHGRAVHAAANALTEALATMRSEVMHGRNYQTSSNPEAARHVDMARVDSYLTAALAVSELGIEIYMKGD
jgi:hypothetical protein